MLVVSWIVFAVLALLWTAAAWAGAALAGWGAEALAAGGAAQVARDVAALPVPGWVQLWFDPAWIEALQSFMRWALDAGGSLLPAAGTLAGWLVPLVWFVWGIGFALLAGGALAAHVVVRRIGRRRLLAG